MRYEIDLKNCRPASVYALGGDFAGSSARGDVISFNNFYMEKNGRPFFAVSGEFHYSRMDDARWEDEIIKMRLGGVNIVSTYLFWNHIEEEEGVFDFTGRRDLRKLDVRDSPGRPLRSRRSAQRRAAGLAVRQAL